MSCCTLQGRGFARVVEFAVTLAIVGLLIAPNPALAINTIHGEYGAPVTCGDLNRSTWFFEPEAEWTSNLKTQFEGGFNTWRYDVEKWSGGYLLSKGGQSWTARWNDLGSWGKQARTLCLGAHNIEFNSQRWSDYDQGSLSLKAVAAHEWGHAFGLGHVGYEDAAAYSQRPPTMSTCNSMSSRDTLSNDDEAAITAQNETSGSYRNVTANASFEENESGHIGDWFTQNVSTFSGYSSGGGVDGSPWYARFKGNTGATNAAVYNDTYVTFDQGGYLKARVNYRKWSSVDYGTVKVTMKYQPNVHNSQGCGGLNNTASTGGWLATSKYCTPSTSWRYCTTNPLVASGGGNKVVKVRVVAYNRMKRPIDGGIPAYLRIDRTRVLVDGSV